VAHAYKYVNLILRMQHLITLDTFPLHQHVCLYIK